MSAFFVLWHFRMGRLVRIPACHAGGLGRCDVSLRAPTGRLRSDRKKHSVLRTFFVFRVYRSWLVYLPARLLPLLGLMIIL